MSVSTTTTEVSYTGTGAAPMPVPFPFFEEGDLEVTADGVAVGFSVTGNPRTASASVVLDAALGTSQTILIRRAVDLLQPSTFGLQGTFSPKTHEAAFDRAVMQIQDEHRTRVEAVAAEAAARIAGDIAAGSALAAEAATRAAADAALVAAGVPVATAGSSFVTPTGRTALAARTLSDWTSDAQVDVERAFVREALGYDRAADVAPRYGGVIEQSALAHRAATVWDAFPFKYEGVNGVPTPIFGEFGSKVDVVRATVGALPLSTGEVSAAANTARICDVPAGVLIEPERTQYFVTPDAPATQTIAGLAVGTYFVWIEGTGSVAITLNSGTATGLPLTVTARTGATFAVTALASVTVTVTGSVTFCQVENGYYGTSKIHAAGARAADKLSCPNPITGNVWSVNLVIAQPRWHKVGRDGCGIWGIGTHGAANSAVLYQFGGALVFRVINAAGVEKVIQKNAYSGLGYAPGDLHEGHAVRIGISNNNGALSIWNDSEVEEAFSASITGYGAGDGLITTQPATMWLGRVEGLTAAIPAASDELGGYLSSVHVSHVATVNREVSSRSRPSFWPLPSARLLTVSDSILAHFLFRDLVGPFLGIEAHDYDRLSQGGGKSGLGLLEFADSTIAYDPTAGTWHQRKRGSDLGQYSGVLLMLGANDGNSDEAAAIYRRTMEKIYCQALKFVPKVVLGFPPRQVDGGMAAWASYNQYERTYPAYQAIVAKWNAATADLYAWFSALVNGNVYAMSELYRDTIHQTYGYGMAETAKAFAVGYRKAGGQERSATPEITGKVITYLFGQPTAGWSLNTITVVTAFPFYPEGTVPAYESARLFGMDSKVMVSSGSGQRLVFPTSAMDTLWLHYMWKTGTAPMATVYIDRGTAAEIQVACNLGGAVDNYLQSIPIAGGLAAGLHSVEIETTNGTPAYIIGFSYVGVP